jgi:hypothetical protein
MVGRRCGTGGSSHSTAVALRAWVLRAWFGSIAAYVLARVLEIAPAIPAGRAAGALALDLAPAPQVCWDRGTVGPVRWRQVGLGPHAQLRGPMKAP